jgi:hypothetical protein
MSGQPIREEGDVPTLLRLGVLCDGKKRSNRVEGRQGQLRETHLLGRREVEHQIGFDEGLGRDVKESNVLLQEHRLAITPELGAPQSSPHWRDSCQSRYS